MNASAQYGRFGSGKAVRRVEDESLLKGTGQFVDDHNARAGPCAVPAFAVCARAHLGIDTKARGRDAGRRLRRDRPPISCAPA